jgi:drug/metabolite transporter (DMT)-like permease
MSSPLTPLAQPSRTRVFATLVGGVLAVSTAALFIRLAQGSGAESLAIAAGRLVLASLIIVPIAWLSKAQAVHAVNRRDVLRMVLVGGMLAAHFWLWIASLKMVSVALSTALVSTTPIWVALGNRVFFGERITALQAAGLLLAIAGGVGLALTDSTVTQHRQLLLGCLLALGGAWTITVNMLVGQRVRARLPVRTYAAMSYGFAALWLLVGAWLTQTKLLGLPANAYWCMLALALVPQLLGHTALNWALPFLGSTTVAVSVLAEPVGAAVLAAALLKEPLTPIMVICFAVTLLGIVLVAIRKSD